MLSVNHLDRQQCGQSGSHGAAQVTEQAVREGEEFPQVLSPTSAPLAHEPQIFNRGLMRGARQKSSETAAGVQSYSQGAGEQRKERRRAAEADGDAEFEVRVTGRTGQD